MRIAVGLAYDGSSLGGWQFQGHDPNTVQNHVERALGKVAGHKVSVVAAGRTDAGVHASGMVAHFDTQAQRSAHSWVQGANTYLPDCIAMRWAQPVSEDFHARFKATRRRYRYIIYCHPYRSALWQRQVCWNYRSLDLERMQQAATALVGEHDFTSFRAVACQARHPVRHVHFLNLWRQGRLLILDIQANGFLHHMVRNIAGALMAVGEGKQTPAWVGEVLAARDRTQAGVTASAYGLYFIDVGYPECFSLPQESLGPHFLQDACF